MLTAAGILPTSPSTPRTSMAVKAREESGGYKFLKLEKANLIRALSNQMNPRIITLNGGEENRKSVQNLSLKTEESPCGIPIIEIRTDCSM